MALTHVTAARNAMADACVDRIDLESGTANGALVIMGSGDTAIATLQCAQPAFTAGGSATAGVATANTITNDSSAAVTLTASLFKFQDRTAAEIFRGTVGSGSGDIDLSSVAIGAGDTVSITSFTYAASA